MWGLNAGQRLRFSTCSRREHVEQYFKIVPATEYGRGQKRQGDL